jgi:hypothetical protein
MIKKFLLIYIAVFLTACSTNNDTVKNTTKPEPGLFSKDASVGINITDLLGPRSDENSINVNGYLWRASLDVLSIAPLISTDALGGIIITDWYTNKNIKDKRIKITAHIRTSELRSDGIKVKVHVQKLIDNIWSDTVTDNNLASRIEDNILNEARNLRVNANK